MVHGLAWTEEMLKLSEQLERDDLSGDFGRALNGYPERALMLEKEITAWRDRFPQYRYRPQNDCVALDERGNSVWNGKDRRIKS